MPFRFRKSIKLAPGIKLNLSKSGISTSIGVKGAQITRGNDKTRVTVGLPGTGLSHSTVTSNKDLAPSPIPSQQTHWFIQVAKALGSIVGVIAVVALGIFAALMASGGKGKRR